MTEKKKFQTTKLFFIMMLFMFLMGYNMIAKSDLSQCVDVNSELMTQIEHLEKQNNLEEYKIPEVNIGGTVTPTTEKPNFQNLP